MEQFKRMAPGLIRVLLSALFLVSAIAKLYPSPYFAISTFEAKQLYPMGFSELTAAYFSRTLIGIEFALGILLLQSHYLRKLVMPATFAMLLVFTTHLTIQSFVYGGNTGNCGCFGSLLPMTPIEAIVKNIVGMLLIVGYWKWSNKPSTQDHNFWLLSTVSLGCILAMYVLAPIQPPASTLIAPPTANITAVTDSLEVAHVDSLTQAPLAKPTAVVRDTVVVEKPTAPKPKKSGYAAFFPGIDQGRHTLCFFVPGCDHCREAAKEMTEMRKTIKDFPKISIIFMNEEADLIPEFFKAAGATYPYTIVEIIPFWKMLGSGKDTPGVKYLWNGNEYKYYFGIQDQKFDPANYKKLISKDFETLTTKK